MLLDAGADATARNFAGALPHQLAVEGSPPWASLLAELDWRACLEQPRPCQYTASEGMSKYHCSVPKIEDMATVECPCIPHREECFIRSGIHVWIGL